MPIHKIRIRIGKKITFLLLALGWTLGPCLGQQLTGLEYSNIRIGDYLLFEDSTSKLSVSQVEKIMEKKNYVNITKAELTHESSAYWMRFKILNYPKDSTLAIQFNFAIDSIEFYAPLKNGNYIKETSGFKILPEQNYGFYAPLFILPKANHQYYYFRFKGRRFQGFQIVRIDTLQKYIDVASEKENYFGVFIGIVIIISIYGFIFFLILKEKAYLYYALYVLSFGLYCSVYLGIIGRFLPFPISFSLNLYFIPYSLMTIFLMLYIQNFFNTKKTLPFYHNIISLGISIKLLLILLSGFVDSNFIYSPSIDILFITFSFFVPIKRAIQGFKPAIYVSLGFLILYISYTIHSLDYHEYGSSWNNLRKVLSIENLGLAEIIIFSFSLASRFKALKLEKHETQRKMISTLQNNVKYLEENSTLKDKLNYELDNLVKERTIQLEEQNKLLEEQNEILEEQAKEIERINQLLSTDNVKLKKNVEEVTTAIIMQKTITFEEFQITYPDENSCYDFLANLKWNNGYKCRKCGSHEYIKGKKEFSRKCRKCQYEESPTVGTIFNRLKFPIVKGFYILFLVSTKKDISVTTLSNLTQVRLMTCSLFKRKILQVIDEKKHLKKIHHGWENLIFDESNSILPKG